MSCVLVWNYFEKWKEVNWLKRVNSARTARRNPLVFQFLHLTRDLISTKAAERGTRSLNYVNKDRFFISLSKCVHVCALFDMSFFSGRKSWASSLVVLIKQEYFSKHEDRLRNCSKTMCLLLYTDIRKLRQEDFIKRNMRYMISFVTFVWQSR